MFIWIVIGILTVGLAARSSEPKTQMRAVFRPGIVQEQETVNLERPMVVAEDLPSVWK